MLSPDIARARRPVEPRGDGTEVVVALHDKLTATLSKIEREMIKVALREHQGKVEAAAKALGISRKGLYLKRQRLGL
jgi:DNA-binding NtrC family response regulator